MAVSRKIILVPLLLITVLILLGTWFIDSRLHRAAILQFEKNVTDMAKCGARTIRLLDKNATLEDFDGFADMFANKNRFRVTVIDTTGMVLGDSQLSGDDISRLKSYMDRPEILQARKTGVGIARRYSATLGEEMLCVAVSYHNSNNRGYFRVAASLSEFNREHSRAQIVAGAFCGITLLVFGVLSLLASSYVVRIVNRGKQTLHDHVKKKTNEIKVLGSLVTQLTACNSVEEVFKVVGVVAPMLLPGFSGALALMHPSRDRLEIATTWNGQWAGESSYSPDECWALRTGRPHTSASSSGTVACGHSTEQQGRMVCIPLVAQGETYGVLHLSAPYETEWTEEERRLASAGAEYVSLTFANLRLRESLKQQAIRDPLTGLYNRRYLLETMGHELSRATRRNQQLGVLMMDLDHFKKFNDEYGHDAGDFILSEFGRLVKLFIRNGDIPCRYGGEEFAVLLPEADAESASHIASRIAQKVREHDFVFNNRSHGPVTVSIGVALFPENGRSPEDLLKQADRALYEAKKSGRDRVVLAEAPPGVKTYEDSVDEPSERR